MSRAWPPRSERSASPWIPVLLKVSQPVVEVVHLAGFITVYHSTAHDLRDATLRGNRILSTLWPSCQTSPHN